MKLERVRKMNLFRNRIKAIICSLVLLSAASSLFAIEEYVSKAYKEIDQIFVDKSEELLNDVLQQYQNDKNYYLIQNYAQKKIRRLILNDEYNFAMTAIIIVIENDLDNEEALEMYSVISDAFEAQKRQEELALEAQEKEIARIEMVKEKQRGTVEKEYVSSATAAGKTVYVTGTETRLTSTYWNLDMGIVNFTSLIDKANDINGFNYGISGDYTYEYISEKRTIGVDVTGAFKFLALGDSASSVPLMIDISVLPKMGITKNVFGRFGIEGVVNAKTSAAADTAMDNFFSPAVGVSLEKLKLGSMTAGFGVNYLAGHLLYKDINFAMSADAKLMIPIGETEKLEMDFILGLKDQLFMKSNGMENRASVILAVGAHNVIR